ncbi:protein C12orf4 homolog [Tigriopus californicus]|uniref:protein C12orf4 homolog n=1 Tax=Tigriopus californicus TaxID=6832 RepID=UPI0027DA3159|nr:protein C12orf4 homolog [Tigriopus californicus]|eukprot:TCALIF_13231-PA protein Name:"Similar to D6Wsu163e Uncharacterized protein C12orf4 homolog (Mus musculus)" AED:0.16 eAED:0.16 QI:0/-1/0/1/-1/1/1/0/457
MAWAGLLADSPPEKPEARPKSDEWDERDEQVSAWSTAFSQQVLSWAHPPAVDEQEVLAEVYHSLIHSHLSEPLLRLEHTHAEDMERTARAAQDSTSGGLSAPVPESPSGVQSAPDWLHAQETQRREVHHWLMTVHDQFQGGAGPRTAAPVSSASSAGGGLSGSMSRSDSAFALPSGTASPHACQESFTITLGAQMKHMHNLRLIASDPLDLCRYPAPMDDALPHRLQTSMSLYSTNLSGLVLLSSADPWTRPSDLTRELMTLVQRSTDYHFPTFERQIQTILTDHVGPALTWRRARPGRTSPALESTAQGAAGPETTGLMTGDFLVTQHSNLCGVHALFHLISDESVLNGNINSRHPVVLGLRNVMKTACLSDVTTVTLPLLLTHTMTETMTVQWCLKRAELIFKCVKGFMMEVASWGGSELKTLQFLVPQDIDPDVFHRLTSMLASIFRTSNPISF